MNAGLYGPNPGDSPDFACLRTASTCENWLDVPMANMDGFVALTDQRGGCMAKAIHLVRAMQWAHDHASHR